MLLRHLSTSHIFIDNLLVPRHPEKKFLALRKDDLDGDFKGLATLLE